MNEGACAEVYYSANSIRNKIKESLFVFGFQPVDMRVYRPPGTQCRQR